MELFLNITSLVLSFFVTVLAIPPILRVAKAKKLFDPVNERKVHTRNIPPLGGVAIFIGFVLSCLISSNEYSFVTLKYIVAAAILVFFIGLKDDLIDIPAWKKLVVQFFAALILIIFGNIHFTTLHGMLGIYEVSEVTGMLLSLILILALMNAFNLIDGIDGLASGLAIVAASVFGVWFYLSGHFQYAIIAFALAGSLAGFFIFNVFGGRNKLFMGDAGSLLVGMVISVLVIQFNEFNLVGLTPFSIVSSPVVSFAIVVVPLVDMIRVMLIRILKGRSPFVADKNHIHHMILAFIPNHLHVTLIIISINLIFISFAFVLNESTLNINIQFLLFFVAVVITSLILPQIIRYKTTKQKKKEPIGKYVVIQH